MAPLLTCKRLTGCAKTCMLRSICPGLGGRRNTAGPRRSWAVQTQWWCAHAVHQPVLALMVAVASGRSYLPFLHKQCHDHNAAATTTQLCMVTTPMSSYAPDVLMSLLAFSCTESSAGSSGSRATSSLHVAGPDRTRTEHPQHCRRHQCSLLAATATAHSGHHHTAMPCCCYVNIPT